MSSIDKYVVRTARDIDRGIRVDNSGGRIRGYKNGDLVFDLSDREGYLSESERNEISSSISNYNALQARQEEARLRREEEERRRLEMLEKERVDAIIILKNAIDNKIYELNRNKDLTNKAIQDCKTSISNRCNTSGLQEFNITGLEQKISSLKEQIDSSENAMEMKKKLIQAQLNEMKNNISQSQATQTSNNMLANLTRTNVIFNNVLPIEKVDVIAKEIDLIKADVNELKNIHTKLKEITANFEGYSLKNDEIFCNLKIDSYQDVVNATNSLRDVYKQVQSHAYEVKDDEIRTKIKNLEGMFTNNPILKNRFESSYETLSFKNEIVQVSEKVYKNFALLENKKFTTCSTNRINELKEIVQNLVLKGDYSETVLNELKSYDKEYEAYKNQDILLELDYLRYERMKDELINLVEDPNEIINFDTNNVSFTIDTLIDQLVKYDIKNECKEAKEASYLAEILMRRNGFVKLYSDINTGDSSDGLAINTVYVRPGCKGVVYEVTCSADGIWRRTSGIKRTNGNITSVERILEVAKIDESDDDKEMRDFLSDYFELRGVQEPEFKTAVGASDNDSYQTVENSSCFSMTEEIEEKYEEIHQAASPEEHSKYVTIDGSMSQRPILNVENNHINEIKEQIRNNLRAKRR